MIINDCCIERNAKIMMKCGHMWCAGKNWQIVQGVVSVRQMIIETKITLLLTSWYSRNIFAMIASHAIILAMEKMAIFLSFFLSQMVAHNMVMMLL
jgi:hypothetical protein